jgi:predicted dehydrogenase
VALRIGFIGCGGIAAHHATQLQQIRTAKTVAGADLNTKGAKAFAKKFGLEETYSDYNEMLAKADIDAVWVCLPTFLHKEATLAAARAGKHVFCEKPMAMHVRDARQMIAACEKAGVLLTVGFVRQYDQDWGTMRKTIAKGTIGRPVVWQSVSGGAGPAAPWFNDAKMGGGPLIDGAVHNYEFAISMFGRGTVAQASSHTFNPKNTGQDTATAIVRFEQGDELVMSWSWGMASGARAESFQQLIGPKGSIQWGAAPDLLPKGFDPATQGAYTVTTAGGKQKAVVYKKNNMFLEQMKHVVTCFAAGKQPKVTGQHGLDSLAIAESILKSGPVLRAVKVPGK